jgi:OOP family OmpA-OmpF porin
VYAEPFVNDPRTEVILTNNWSVTANLWRDFMFTDRFGIYAGGGLGGGGYKLGERTIATGDTIYADAKGAFAWQVGAGLIYELTDRLTVDVSYRYYELDTIQQSSFVTPNQFSSSEVMVGLRLYEPFRHWRK